MIKTIVTCDRCGQEDTGHASNEVDSATVQVSVNNGPPQTYTRDLCTHCLAVVIDTLTEKPARSAK